MMGSSVCVSLVIIFMMFADCVISKSGFCVNSVCLSV